MNEKRVLITGASGFLGGCLVETLLRNPRWTVRAMAHRPGRAIRLARRSTDIVWADLLKPDQVRAAVAGVDAVVHCAYGADAAAERAVTVVGTRNLAQAAAAAGVKRFVHISTIAVYSYRPPDSVTEDTPCIRSGDPYCDAKIEAEREISRAFPEAAILRMGNIYGPFSAPWTVRPLTHIRTRTTSLVDGGRHASNMVFVNNAADAIMAALETDSASGERFFITDDPCSWRDIYGFYSRWLGGVELISAPYDDIRRLIAPTLAQRTAAFGCDLWNGIMVPSFRYTAFRAATSPRFGPVLSRLWQRVPETLRYRIVGDPMGKSVPPASAAPAPVSGGHPPPGLLAIYSGRAVFSNEKARRRLGYGPRIPLDAAMERTRRWAEWARLLP